MILCPNCSQEVEEDLAFCPHCGSEMETDAGPDTHVGTVIKKNFAIRELLGEGGMGKVYLGEQLSLKKPVAIKILKQELSQGETFARRFEREALAASRLHHPNSIQVIEFGRAEGGELAISAQDTHTLPADEAEAIAARESRSTVLRELREGHAAGFDGC